MKLHPIPTDRSTLRVPFWIILYLCATAIACGIAMQLIENADRAAALQEAPWGTGGSPPNTDHYSD